ncbi:hypothetical protein BS78_06G028100 [Paspalum vaginatum]|nr:hypothetical protein BS78_06G028100 [Paspalum vaginatum]KAJ1270090.1 hypothetical protein BS78_06G028100 [Paspalum vaginatum]KAJ1270092.1 hypothetical protein BS78_06G028100 [Paspalum vaginatum]KAJ1270095.1 hypothetical protein BS78_06G028100 [Paspalum vaginatum]
MKVKMLQNTKATTVGSSLTRHYMKNEFLPALPSYLISPSVICAPTQTLVAAANDTSQSTVLNLDAPWSPQASMPARLPRGEEREARKAADPRRTRPPAVGREGGGAGREGRRWRTPPADPASAPPERGGGEAGHRHWSRLGEPRRAGADVPEDGSAEERAAPGADPGLVSRRPRVQRASSPASAATAWRHHLLTPPLPPGDPTPQSPRRPPRLLVAAHACSWPAVTKSLKRNKLRSLENSCAGARASLVG